MHIDQSNYLDNNRRTDSLDSAKGIANYIRKEAPAQGMAGIAASFGTAEEMEITASGSIFMGDATYPRPGQEKEHKTAADQLEANEAKSVNDRRNQMAVLANTTSPEDFAKIQESGFSLTEADSATIITVTDEIKAVLAKAGVDISIYGDTLSEEELSEITGNRAVAAQIKQQMKAYDLPVTEENMEDALKAYTEADSLDSLSEDAMQYMIRNQLPPTIRNIYCAEYSSAGNNRSQSLSDSDFAAMKEQISQIITDAGLSINEDTMADSRWLIEKGLPLTAENLAYLGDLKDLSAQLASLGEEDGQQFLISAMAEAVSEGKRPADGMLLSGYSMRDQAEEALDVIQNVQEEDLAYCIERGEELTVANLKTAIANRGTQIVTREGLALLTAKRQLEEIRLAMTAEANYALLKKGISIDTRPLEELVEQLKNQENQYYEELLNQEGVEATPENVAVFKETAEVISDLKSYPAYVLNTANPEDTLHTMHENGVVLKDTFEKANQSYETLMTAPRADMGDSIQKAFQNVDDILNGMGLETTEANRRAVRILAYNQTEITQEAIERVKATDEEVQRAFGNLTPKVTLEMIRRGVNPLDMGISELNQVAEEIKSEVGNSDEDRFQKFLFKLEQNHKISEEERSSYIGVYRLIAQVEKTDGAVIGSLLNQGADITMRSLLTAVRSGKKGEMDYRVDEEFQGANAVYKNARIDEQINTAFQQNCVRDIVDTVSPSFLEAVPQEVWEGMTPEEMKEAIQKANTENPETENEAAYAKEQIETFSKVLSASEDVYAFLEHNDLANSVDNIMAAEQMLRNPDQMFEMFWNTKGASFDGMKEIQKMKEEVLERFGEAIKTPEELAKAQEELAETAERVMQTMIIENEHISTLDLRELRLMNQQLSICAKRTEEECYMIPMQTGDKITGVNLRVVRGKDEKGLVDIWFRGGSMGKISASFEAKEHGISGMIATDDEETRKFLSENLGLLAEKLGADGSEEADLRVAWVPDLSLSHYSKSSMQEKKVSPEENPSERNPVQTKRLYHIAESFIQTMQELTN